MKARIAEIRRLAPGIKRLTLLPVAGEFPAGAAGAHIVVEIPGPERAWKNPYSLVTPPNERNRYEIIVRRVENSRGGSAWLHDHAAPGQVLDIGMPYNLFPISTVAARHLLLSAGIGITPFLSYLPALRASGAAFEWHHCCRPSEAEAFRGLLPAGENTVLHSSRDTLDLAGLLGRQRLQTHLYVCGPEAFMDVVIATARKCGWPRGKIHEERFAGAAGGAGFRVRLARSNIQLQVREDESLLEALEAAGLQPPCLCRGGACGVCELPVLAGEPEHRDHVLPEEKRAANAAIMTCVSRAKTPELVLDF